jgi:hypothetical protein
VLKVARVPASMSPAKSEGSKKPAKPVKAPKLEKATPAVSDVAPVARTGATNRVIIALPFSQVRRQEPSGELADLVAVVGELVTRPGGHAARFEDLQAQVDSLRARLH